MKNFLLTLAVLAALTSSRVFAASPFGPDVGPKADVAGVRAAVKQHSLQPLSVHISGDYALLEWTDSHDDGIAVYKRVSGEHWKLLNSNGGVYQISDLVSYGVPAAIARKLCSSWPTDYRLCQQ
jgi:hypothetical protein